MKTIATGLLVLAAIVYVPARLFEAVHPAVGYLRALCEAAMIGGLADWFAVTALFRHPLGVPLAHTAIIPANKDRIAEALGRFVEFNFLSTEVMTERLAKVDFARLAAGWMADPERSGPAVAKVLEFLPKLLAMPGAEPLRAHARELLARTLDRSDLAPLVGATLGALAHPDRCRALVDQALAVRGDAESADEALRQRLEGGLRAMLGLAQTDQQASEAFIARASQAWLELRADPAHPAREFLSRWLEEQLLALRDSPALPALVLAAREALGSAPQWREFAQSVSTGFGVQLREDTSGAQASFCVALQAAVCGLGVNIGANPLVQFFLNAQVRKMALGVVERHRHHAAELITDTMRTWDANTMSGRVEEAIGRDLQYIRINGTVIGGLIGVLIHAITTLALH